MPSNPPLSEQLNNRIARDFTPRWTDLWGGKFMLHGVATPTSRSIHLDGNDYLSLTGHPKIIDSQVSNLLKNQQQVVQSGVFVQETHPSRDFEKKLCQLLQKEDGVLCQSGYMANIGLLQAIADKDTTIYVDSLAHASLWEGVHAARANAQMFRHNDPEHLDRVIGKTGKGIVLVDSVYSTTGAICPLKEMLDVVEKNECMIVVDESHSLGTHGPYGAGLCVALGVSDRVHFITSSLAKAFAGRAGFLTLPSKLRYHLLTTSFPNIFSSCLLSHEIAGLSSTLDVILESAPARAQLHRNTRRVRGFLQELGYPIHQGTEQIIALEAGTEPATIALRNMLEQEDVFGSMFCAPATSRNRAMVRLTVNAGLSDDDLSRIEAGAAKIAPIVKPWDWPIARRAKSGSSS